MSVWNLYADQMRTLKGRLGFKAESSLEFLAYGIQLDSGRVLDKLKGKYVLEHKTLYVLLSHYAKNDPIERLESLLDLLIYQAAMPVKQRSQKELSIRSPRRSDLNQKGY